MTTHHAHRKAAKHRQGRLIAAAVALVALVAAGVVAITHMDRHASGQSGRSSSSSATSTPSSTIPVSVTAGGPPVPKTGAYLGAWVTPDPFSQPGRVETVQRFENQIGTQLRIVHLYRTWVQPVGTESDLQFAKRGSYLLLSWATPDLNSVVDGSQDKLIAERARQIKSLPTKVFLEVRWEMDRSNLKPLVHDGATYIAAWKHIQKIFAAQKVTNVGWTWCPTAGGFDNGAANSYYPGDAVVDWICADVYPKTPWVHGKYESFPSLAAAFMTWAQAHPSKPILFGEVGVGSTYGSRRAQWIAEAAQYVVAHRQVKAVMWFDQSLSTDPSYYHFALTDQSSLQAFAKLAQSSYFQPKVS